MTPAERRAWVEEQLAELNPEALYMDGLDAALVGYVSQGPSKWLAAYDEDLIIETLMETNGWDRTEAIEWYSFNTESAWVGEGTPVILHRTEDPD